MLENYIIYAILSAVFAGLFSFVWKISAEKNHNSFVAIWYAFLASAFFAGILLLFEKWNFEPLWLLLILALWNAIFYMISLVTRNSALKHIDSSIYFPIYKVLAGIIVTAMWVIIFKEELSLWELLWIIIWMFIPLILITKKENSIQKNLKQGVILAITWAIFWAITISFWKILVLNNLSPLAYVSIGGLVWWIVSLRLWGEKLWNIVKISHNKMKRYALIWGLFLFLSMYTFIHAIKGNIAIAYTINSFSILIPILLSVIFYQEKLDTKKIIVILLSIVSIVLFKVF